MTRITNYKLYRMSAAWLGMTDTAGALLLPQAVDHHIEVPVLRAVNPATRHLRWVCTGDLT